VYLYCGFFLHFKWRRVDALAVLHPTCPYQSAYCLLAEILHSLCCSLRILVSESIYICNYTVTFFYLRFFCGLNTIFFKWSQIGAHYFLVVYLFQILSICFGQLCAHRQENLLYLRHWYFSFCMGGCLVCRVKNTSVA